MADRNRVTTNVFLKNRHRAFMKSTSPDTQFPAPCSLSVAAARPVGHTSNFKRVTDDRSKLLASTRVASIGRRLCQGNTRSQRISKPKGEGQCEHNISVTMRRVDRGGLTWTAQTPPNRATLQHLNATSPHGRRPARGSGRPSHYGFVQKNARLVTVPSVVPLPARARRAARLSARIIALRQLRVGECQDGARQLDVGPRHGDAFLADRHVGRGTQQARESSG